MKGNRADGIGQWLRLDHFAAFLLALVLSAVFLTAFRFATNIYLIEIPIGGGLIAIAVLAAATIAVSKLGFNFARKDAAGLAIAMAILAICAVALMGVAAGYAGYYFPSKEYLINHAGTGLISLLIYFGLLSLLLKEKDEKQKR